MSAALRFFRRCAIEISLCFTGTPSWLLKTLRTDCSVVWLGALSLLGWSGVPAASANDSNGNPAINRLSRRVYDSRSSIRDYAV